MEKAASEGPVEVRLLGVLSVRLPDGTAVAHTAWRTTKSRQLLRLLALHAGTPVPADRLIEALWPAAEPHKARASLRTAASQIRQVLGKDCVARQFDGLVLRHAWVDVAAFESLAAGARRLFAQGEHSEGLAAAQEAAALYADDLCADEPYAEWAFTDRERLRRLRAALSAEAAEAALALGRHRTAIRLAEQLVACEPATERAYRVLMRAHATLGETDSSLKAYERCSAALADELGADPSPETRALHVQLLSTAGEENRSAAFAGRDAEVETVRAHVAESLREGDAMLVLVSGPEGSGRTRLADEACTPWSDRLLQVRPVTDDREPPTLAGRLCGRLRARHGEGASPDCHEAATVPDTLAEAVMAAAPLVIRLDDLEREDPFSLKLLRRIIAELSGPVVVVATSAPLDDPGSALAKNVRALASRGRAVEVPVGPLAPEAVDELLADLLTERATPQLLQEVMDQTEGQPGRVVRAVRDLSRAGSLTVTRSGVMRLPPETVDSGDADAMVQRLRAALDPVQGAVLDVVSVLGSPFTVDDVAALRALSRGEVRHALDVLVDERLLTVEGSRYRFRDAHLADAAYNWLRPSTRRQLHEVVAGSPRMSPAARVEHWEAAGEAGLACAAARYAAAEASARGDYQQQRAHAVRARSLADLAEATPRDRLVVAELLGDACRGLRRFAEAGAAFEEAADLARAHAPGELARLSRKLGTTTGELGNPEALGWYRRALTEPSDEPLERVRTTSAIGAMLALNSPVAAEEVLRSAVGMADHAGDVATQIEARVLLGAHALVRMRRFAESQRWLQEALAIAEAAEHDALLAQTLLAGKEATMTLASTWPAVATLSRAEDLAMSGEPEVRRDARLLLALAAHELAGPDFSRRWAASWTEPASVPETGVWRWVPARVLYERGHLVKAGEVLARSLRGDQGALDFQLVRLPAARLAAERGDTAQAVALLRAAADRAVDTGVTLVLPEVAARLAALEAAEDPAAGAARLEQAEAALGEYTFPREQAAILLARAALLAVGGQPQAAADMAGAAAAASRAAGLVFAHAEALTRQAGYLATAGQRTRALAALRRAGELYAHADAPARVRATSQVADRLGLDWEAPAASR